MKKKNNVLVFTLVICTVMTVFTCKQNVGLGGTVDIERPEGSITYPDAGETPIRGSFVMRGTAYDDDGIKSITISFKNVKTEEIVKSYSVGGFTEGDGSVSWSINIDNTSTGNEPEPHDLVKKYPIPDGEYTAILTVTDKGGKTYETTKNYKIDNTPPVFIVQRPYTTAGITDEPLSGDGYGSVFSVVGQVGEQNTVEKLVVNVPNKNIKIDKMYVSPNINAKVETHTIPLPATNSLYKLQAEDINKAIKAQLFLFDNARLYNDESSSTDTEGNKSEWFYLWDDISPKVIEKGYNPEVIRDYFAGKKGSDAADADDHDKMIAKLRNDNDALKALKDKRINMGTDCSTFKLDPSKSPGFKVLGVDLLPNDPSKFNAATPILFKNGKENFFIAELVRNKDNKSIVPGDPLKATSYSGSDIEIKLSKWKGPSSPNDFEDGISVLKFSNLTQNNLTVDNLITVTAGGNLRVKCKLPNGFEEGKYRVEVKGTDTGGEDFAAYDISNTVTSNLYIIDFLQAGEGVKVKAAPIRGFYNKKVKIEAKVAGLNASGHVYYNIGAPVSETSPDSSKILDPDGSDGKYSKEIDISNTTDYPDGEYKVYIFARNGGADQNQKDSDYTSFEVDRKAPELEINSPNLTTNISGDFLMSGKITDEKIGIESIKYIKGKQPSKPTVDTPDGSWTNIALDAGAWKIDFSGTNSITSKAKASEIGTEVPGSGGKLYDIPIYFLVKDKLGNADVIEKKVRVDPYGDIPEVTILNPAANSVLGGAIRISGTVSVPKPEIGMVGAMQIQITNKKKTGLEDPDFEQSAVFGGVDWCPPGGKDLTYTPGSPYWSIEINKNREFESATSDDQVIWFRLRGKNNKTPADAGQWTDPVKITVNKKAPTITGVKVSTETNINTPIPGGSVVDPDNRAYVSNMWIKGDALYLCADLAHSAGIEKIEISGSYFGASTITLTGHSEITGSSINGSGKSWFTQSLVQSTTDAKNYKMHIPLTTLGMQGTNFNIKVVITAKKTGGDVQGLTAQSSWELKYDNTAPVAVFGIKIFSSGSFKITGNEFTDSALIGKTNINNSMSVFASGQRKKIISFDPTTGKVTLESPFSTPTKEGYLIYAPIKYLRPGSSGKVGVFGAAYDVGAGVEKVKVKYKVDSTETPEKTLEFPLGIQKDVGNGNIGFVTWNGELDTNALGDGKGILTITPIDAAGNSPSPITVEVKHKKNSLAISTVQLGTDLNRNGSIETSETRALSIGYGTLVATSGIDQIDYDWHGNSDGGTFRFKNNKSHIKIETTGGNGANKYTLKRKKISNPPPGVDIPEAEVHNLRTLPSNGIIELNQTDFDKIKQSDNLESSNPTKRTLVLTVWDSAHNLVCGTDTWKAEFELDVIVDTKDRKPPTNDIDLFKWVSETDNSLYSNSRDNGHIEIGADLPAAFTTGGMGLMDRDDKVSGKISIIGTAHDDQVITQIWAKIDDFKFTGAAGAEIGVDTKLATYKKNTAGTAYTGEFEYASGNNNFATNGWKFTILSNDFSVENGHTVKWQLDWDSSKITGGVGVDKTITVTVKDESTDNSHTVSATRKVDVVPYVRKIETYLSGLDDDNPDLYARTALGHYPVRDDETIKIHGFNLTGASVTVGGKKTNNLVGYSSPWTLNFTDNASTTSVDESKVESGALAITVGSVSAGNNINNNDKPYNKAKKTASNDKLTDDLYLDVWQFNSEAAQASSSTSNITEPVMRINPVNGMIGFAFANSYDLFSMSYGKENSYKKWHENFDDFAHMDFIYDNDGNSHAVVAGRDINIAERRAGRFNYLCSKWANNSDSHLSANNNFSGKYGRRLEAAGQENDMAGAGGDIYYKDRIQHPSLVAAPGSGNNPRLYLAYYDAINDQIRFKYGTNDKSAEADFGQFKDTIAGSFIPWKIYKYNQDSVGIIAGKYKDGSSIKDTGNKAGSYLSLGVVSGANAADDVAVLIWFDETTQKLKYTYKKGPQNGSHASQTGNGNGNWKKPVDVFGMRNVGEYCKIAVDKAGGIHIAAFDTEASDLKYAYLPTYSATSFKTCTVDAYGITGTHITLDVAYTENGANGKPVPYIGYYSSSVGRSKLAYLADTSGDAGAAEGTDENGRFTGKWEVSIVPTSSRVQNDNINVGVWKTADGVIKNSVTGAGSSNRNTGKVYGNGTANPVLAYAIKKGLGGYIETAQKK